MRASYVFRLEVEFALELRARFEAVFSCLEFVEHADGERLADITVLIEAQCGQHVALLQIVD